MTRFFSLAAVDVRRIERARRREKQRWFSAKERSAASSRAKPAETLAARLAAKHALGRLLSAAGCLVPSGFYSRVSVMNRASGRPYFRFSGSFAKKFLGSNARGVQVSLTHTGKTGFALVALELKS